VVHERSPQRTHGPSNMDQSPSTYNMKVSLAHISTLIIAFATQTTAYDCWKNTNDAGRWRDVSSPADRLVELCRKGDGEFCHQAEVGKMCVSGPGIEAFCNYVWGWAGSQQSRSGDWFLWSDITCNGGVLGSGDDMHIRIL
jgi:hypothetical protein